MFIVFRKEPVWVNISYLYVIIIGKHTFIAVAVDY